MSAIAALYFPDGRPVENETLDQMTDALEHRGRDGRGTWRREAVGLGHRMLWVTPESLHEQLPLVSEDRELAITADARLDNRRELISQLGLSGRTSEEISDSMLILAAYERWGEQCPEKLLGDFVFAIWDGRARKIFAARDHFGIKTFYYYHQHGRIFALASEIKALFQAPHVPRRLNEVRIADYLGLRVEDKTITFYEEIVQLPPAHSISVSRDGMQISEYWALDPSREIRYGSDEEYAEAFREVFTEAVRCRLRSAYPIGSSLSGGLDSSSVVCVARDLLRGSGHAPLHTFSCVFDELPQCDEREFIQLVLDQGELESHFIHLDRLSVLDDIERMLWLQDEPIWIRNTFLWAAKYRRAQENGIRVVLDGEDGDTVISHGDAYFAELVRAGEWGEFAQQAQKLLRHFRTYHGNVNYWLQTYGVPYMRELAHEGRWGTYVRSANEIAKHFDVSRMMLWKYLVRHGIRPRVPQSARDVWRRVRPQAGEALIHNGEASGDGHSSAPPLIEPDFAKRIGFDDRSRALTAEWSQYVPFQSLRQAHWLAHVVKSPWAYEEIDKLAGSYSVEARHPFHDRRVVEFCLALPPEQKLHDGWPRWILRRSMDKLPEEIRWRDNKSNLRDNFTRSLLVFERERLDDLLKKDPGPASQYVNLSTVHDALSEQNADNVFPAAILALWLRQTGLAS